MKKSLSIILITAISMVIGVTYHSHTPADAQETSSKGELYVLAEAINSLPKNSTARKINETLLTEEVSKKYGIPFDATSVRIKQYSDGSRYMKVTSIPVANDEELENQMTKMIDTLAANENADQTEQDAYAPDIGPDGYCCYRCCCEEEATVENSTTYGDPAGGDNGGTGNGNGSGGGGNSGGNNGGNGNSGGGNGTGGTGGNGGGTGTGRDHSYHATGCGCEHCELVREMADRIIDYDRRGRSLIHRIMDGNGCTPEVSVNPASFYYKVCIRF